MTDPTRIKILIDNIISASSPTNRRAGIIVVEYGSDQARLERLKNDLIVCKKFPSYVGNQLASGLEIVQTSLLEAKKNTYRLQYNSEKSGPIQPVWRT